MVLRSMWSWSREGRWRVLHPTFPGHAVSFIEEKHEEMGLDVPFGDDARRLRSRSKGVVGPFARMLVTPCEKGLLVTLLRLRTNRPESMVWDPEIERGRNQDEIWDDSERWDADDNGDDKL